MAKDRNAIPVILAGIGVFYICLVGFFILLKANKDFAVTETELEAKPTVLIGKDADLDRKLDLNYGDSSELGPDGVPDPFTYDRYRDIIESQTGLTLLEETKPTETKEDGAKPTKPSNTAEEKPTESPYNKQITPTDPNFREDRRFYMEKDASYFNILMCILGAIAVIFIGYAIAEIVFRSSDKGPLTEVMLEEDEI